MTRSSRNNLKYVCSSYILIPTTPGRFRLGQLELELLNLALALQVEREASARLRVGGASSELETSGRLGGASSEASARPRVVNPGLKPLPLAA